MRSLLKFIVPSPDNISRYRLPLTLGEMRRTHKDLVDRMHWSIPDNVLGALARHEWLLYFAAFPTDYAGLQTEPLETDADDPRCWYDEIGGACFPEKGELYAAAFIATGKELLAIKPRNLREIEHTLRHETGHALDAVLARMAGTESRNLMFSALCPAFINAVWQDMLAAGGAEELRARGYGYFTPGNIRHNRHTAEIFAEGMAVIWGRSSNKQEDFTRYFPRSMKLLKDINTRFCAADFRDPYSAGKFHDFMDKLLRAKLFSEPYSDAVAMVAGCGLSLPGFQEWKSRFEAGPDFFFSRFNMAVGEMAKFFAGRPMGQKIGSMAAYLEDFGRAHEKVYASFRHGDARLPEIRELCRELVEGFLPENAPGELDAFKSNIRLAARYGRNPILTRYLLCEDDRHMRDHVNMLEQLALARSLSLYADACAEHSIHDEGITARDLRARHALLEEAHHFVDAILLDGMRHSYDALFSLRELRKTISEAQNALEHEMEGSGPAARPVAQSRRQPSLREEYAYI